MKRDVPPLVHRIDTFKILVDQLRQGHVVWRFDPLVLTESINMDSLLGKIERIGDQLLGYTEKLVLALQIYLIYLSQGTIKPSESTNQLS